MANKKNPLTPEQIEQLAVELRAYLLEVGMWQDVTIYFNGKAFSTYDKNNREFYYNDAEHLVVLEDEDPKTYFEYTNPDHILSMSFEGAVCEMLYYGEFPATRKKFDAIFEKYGLYYEFGDSWNFSCYYI